MSSPQLRYQHRKAEAGLCVTCGTAPAEAGHARCLACHGGPYVGRDRFDWSKADWALNNYAVAKALGCTPRAVAYQRRRRGKPGFGPGKPRKARVVFATPEKGGQP